MLPNPAVADALLGAAWVTLALDSVRQVLRDRAARAALGPVMMRSRRPSLMAGVAVLATALTGAVALERLTGRFVFRPAVALGGLVLVAGGLALHGWARRTLGPHWSGVVQVRADHVLVDGGPYAYVRHPIYLAGLLLAAGSFLAHPSLAAACLAGGFAAGLMLKAWLEERVLRRALGPDYARYAARVPALVPRLGLGRRKRPAD